MKSIEVLHVSFAVFAAVTVIGLVVIGGLVVTSPGVARHLPRLGRCAVFGAVAAGALTWYVGVRRHAQLAAQAAKPVHGQHLSAAYILADGFAFTFVIVTVAAFAVATMVARRRAPVLGRAPSRSRAGAGTWLS